MKRYIALTVLVAGLAGACSEKPEMESLVPSEDNVIITVSFPAETKVSLTEGTDALDLAWEEDDYLIIASGDVRERYEMVSFSGNVATFTGKQVNGSSYDIFLSCPGEDYQDISYAEQTQSTVVSTDHMKYAAVLRGVSDYNAVSFTYDWAEAHGGELLQNGCLLLHFQMPEDVGHIKTVTLTAPDYFFYLTNCAEIEMTDRLVLNMDDADMQADNVVKAHIVTSMQEAQIPAETELTLTVQSNLGIWSKNFTPGAFRLQAGKRNVIKLNSQNWTVPVGEGTEADPYIIRTAEELRTMSSKLGATKKYVALVNDIDASSITAWPSISNTKVIDFNGNNRTISNFKPATFSNDYAGFVGVLNGRIANLNITGAEINGKDGKACGIVCGYLGTANADSFGEVENVHVEGVVNGKAGGVGGLAGILGNGKLNRCSAAVEVCNNDNTVSTYRTGGLVGYYNDGGTSNVCEISDCWTSGKIVGGMQKTGGIIGEVFGNSSYDNTNRATIQNCYSTASLEGMRVVGGIVGYAASKEPTSVLKCIAWNEKIEAKATKHTQYSSGAVVARTYALHTLQDCYRISDINFSCVFVDLEGVEAYVEDQNNVDSSNKLSVGTYSQIGSIYQINECSNWYPYHGKSARSGALLSSVAKSLGWKESIWDFSGALPQLIR